MKQLWKFLKTRDFKGLFMEPTEDTFIQFFRYVFVGGVAFIADVGVLWLLSLWMHYMLATALAFVAGLAVNYALSKWLVFSKPAEKAVVEFIIYGVIGVVGLGITELLMYLFIDVAGVHLVISKTITAAIVLVWNFVARKQILYRK